MSSSPVSRAQLDATIASIDRALSYETRLAVFFGLSFVSALEPLARKLEQHADSHCTMALWRCMAGMNGYAVGRGLLTFVSLGCLFWWYSARLTSPKTQGTKPIRLLLDIACISLFALDARAWASESVGSDHWYTLVLLAAILGLAITFQMEIDELLPERNFERELPLVRAFGYCLGIILLLAGARFHLLVQEVLAGRAERFRDLYMSLLVLAFIAASGAVLWYMVQRTGRKRDYYPPRWWLNDLWLDYAIFVGLVVGAAVLAVALQPEKPDVAIGTYAPMLAVIAATVRARLPASESAS
jgi:hypothetical protein